MGRFENKVALVTGAARSQGRAIAVLLAEEGADVICVDALTPYASMQYDMATADDLAETVAMIEKHGRRAVAAKADVRDFGQLDAAVSGGVEQLGRLDLVVANAGIAPPSRLVHETDLAVWNDVIDTNLTGVFHTLKAALPPILAGAHGGSIVLTASGAGLKGAPHLAHYTAAKHGVIGIMRSAAKEYAAQFVRVNAIAPTAVDTAMIMHDNHYRQFRPDLENPTQADMEVVMRDFNVLPVPWVEVRDTRDATAWLLSDEARYVTGVVLPVDAGMSMK
jgi:(+)-trans-carveol dehydrogenase/(-)-trans-carveol dehydrogenase